MQVIIGPPGYDATHLMNDTNSESGRKEQNVLFVTVSCGNLEINV